MDKTKLPYHTSKQRSGFALMITLSVLSVIIALTMVLLSYFDEVREDADNTKALIQANVYYADILNQLNALGNNKKSLFQRLYKLPISLSSPDNRFKMVINCSPLAQGVDVNWLGLHNNAQKQHLYQIAQHLFDTLAQEYGLQDADRLLEMLLIEISSNRKFVKKSQSRLIQKNGIISYQQFSNIIRRYEIEVDDLKVARVPWSKYFSFSGKAEKIDAEFSSAELISFLFDIDLNTVREWKRNPHRPSLQQFVNNNGGDYDGYKKLLAGSTFLDTSRCSVSFGAGYRFTFDYIAGESKYFEFYGK